MASVFSQAEKNELKLVISPLTMATTNYMLSKQLSQSIARRIVREFRLLVEISIMNDKVVDLALTDEGFTDFEDGLQHYSAIASGCEIIITRDKKDFKNSKLPVMNPGQFLASIR